MRVFGKKVLHSCGRLSAGAYPTLPARGLAFYVPKGPKGPVAEPARGVVEFEDEASPTEVRVPYVSEDTRREIYAKFKQNPSDKSFYQLASDYRMGVTRMKAIVYLMRSREEMMAANGVLEIAEADQEVYALHRQGRERNQQLADLKAELAAKKEKDEKDAAKLAKRKQRDPNYELPEAEEAASELTLEERVAQVEAMKDYTDEVIAEELSVDVSKVKDVIKRLSEHYMRLENLNGHQAQMEQLMEDLRESGVDTNFAETSTEEDARFDNQYFPRLINDNEFDEEVRAQRTSLLMKTRAAYDPAVQDLLSKKYENTSQVAQAVVPNKAGVEDSKFLRSKLAFRDTSNDQTKEGATLIRKRDGSTRVATPYEEMKRSWGGKQPSYLEVALHEKLMEMQLDPDGDDKKAREFVVARHEAKKAAKTENK